MSQGQSDVILKREILEITCLYDVIYPISIEVMRKTRKERGERNLRCIGFYSEGTFDNEPSGRDDKE